MARAKAVTKIIVQVDFKIPNEILIYFMLLMTETSADLLVEPYQNQTRGLRYNRIMTSIIRPQVSSENSSN